LPRGKTENRCGDHHRSGGAAICKAKSLPQGRPVSPGLAAIEAHALCAFCKTTLGLRIRVIA